MGAYPANALERAMKAEEVILRVVSKQLTFWQAASILRISPRHLRRIFRRYEQFGFDGLYDRRRSGPTRGGDRAKLDQCSTSSDTLGQMDREAAAARAVGVIGTPTFLLGRSAPAGAEGTLIEGAPPIDVLESKIDQLLSDAGTNRRRVKH